MAFCRSSRRNQLDHERLPARDVEGVHNTQQRGDGHEVPDLHHMGQRQHRKEGCQQHGSGLGGNHDVMPVIPVRDSAAHAGKEEDRDPIGEAHEHRAGRRIP